MVYQEPRPDETRRWFVLAPCASAVALFSGCSDQGALDGLSAGKIAAVSRVISGDALEIDDGEEVHLAGVEAPRSGQTYADEAADALGRLATGKRVQLLHGGARTDPFGRTVAHVRTVEGQTWLQGALIDTGAVRVRTFADNRALAKPMLAKEAQARAAKRGLWAFDDYRVRLPSEIEDAHGLVIVEGRVQRVGRSGDGGMYLDFDPDWRANISAEIPHEALRDFRSAKLDPADLQGRLVRLRGGLHGLRLTLDHPEQVERLRG